MDGELWIQLYHWIDIVDQFHTQRPKIHSDATIVRTYAWSVLHDRPTCWACAPANWPAGQGTGLPSQPTMSRRLKHDPGVRRFLAELEQTLDTLLCLRELCLCWFIDGKPLPISRYSKDPDADFGYCTGGTDKGYKSHMLWHTSAMPCWDVRPMSVPESRVAKRLIAQTHDQGYVIADKGYDANALHQFCHDRGLQLLAPPKKSKGAGRGHVPQSPARLHALEMLKRPLGRSLLKMRAGVEQRLGNLCSFGGGLSPLPAWVRRLDRVRRWLQMKLMINALRIQRSLERRVA